MTEALADRIERAIGRRPTSIAPLHGGDIAAASRVELADGTRLVAKTSRVGGPATGDIEGRMLRLLAERSDLPVPTVLHAAADLLIMDYFETGGRLTGNAERAAARHIAALHGVTGESHGLNFDTVIGPLPQPNPLVAEWLPFFREHRLVYMAKLAHDADRLPDATLERLEAFADKLADFIGEPEAPSLLHGDLWGGNILVGPDETVAFIDPAIYFGHAEMDLAFITLFSSVGQAFFEEYARHRPIQPGFFEGRRDIYNLWPLLVHVRLFGGSYVSSVEQTLSRFGY